MTWRAGQGLMVLALAVLAAGCVTPRSDPQPMQTYQLALDGQPGEGHPPDVNGPVLLVSVSQPEPGFESPRMVYRIRPYEVQYFSANQWVDAPARLFTPLLVQSLSRSGVWRAVVPLPGAVRGDYRLDSYGVAVQQEFLQRPSHVRVMVRLHLVDLKESRIVGTRAFETMEVAPSDDAYGGVVAANRAMAALLDQVAAWVQGCLRRPAECGRS